MLIVLEGGGGSAVFGLSPE